MKPGLILPTLSTKDIKSFRNDPRKFAIEKRIAMLKKNNLSFEKILDNWKKSGHSIESNKALIDCIRGKR